MLVYIFIYKMIWIIVFSLYRLRQQNTFYFDLWTFEKCVDGKFSVILSTCYFLTSTFTTFVKSEKFKIYKTQKRNNGAGVAYV